MKEIKLTPEWVLEKLSDSVYVDGDGKVTLTIDMMISFSNCYWITLALDTLEIKYEEDEYEIEGDNDSFMIDYSFDLEDIKEECPNLYKDWSEMKRHNKDFTQKKFGLN